MFSHVDSFRGTGNIIQYFGRQSVLIFITRITTTPWRRGRIITDRALCVVNFGKSCGVRYTDYIKLKQGAQLFFRNCISFSLYIDWKFFFIKMTAWRRMKERRVNSCFKGSLDRHGVAVDISRQRPWKLKM